MSSVILSVDSVTLSLGLGIPVGTGEANTAANVGAGSGVFRDKTLATLNLRSIAGIGGIVVAVSGGGNEVEIDGSGLSGGGPSGINGPSSTTDEGIMRWDGNLGGLAQDSNVTVDDAGNVSLPGGATVDGRDVSVDGAAQDTHIADTSNPHAVTAGQAAAVALAEKGAANGVATLDAGTTIPEAQIPATITRDTELAAHTGDTTNPHAVTAAQVGNGTAQWNADKIQGQPVSPTLPVVGQVLLHSGAQWVPTALPGGGDVLGPASSSDNRVARFDGTTGKLIQNSAVEIDDAGNITAIGTVDGRDVAADGAAQDAHIANTANPHATDIANLGGGTLVELNTAITDATLDDSGDPRTPDGAATGQLGGTYPSPDVRGLRETSGPTLMTIGAIPDGYLLKRQGAAIVGETGLRIAAVSGADTTPGFLNDKIAAGNGILKAILTPGGDEDLQISADFGSGANKVTEGDDPRLSDSRTPTGAAAGQLGGTYPNPDVRGIRTTSGPTELTIGAIADGEVLTRSGGAVIGAPDRGGMMAFGASNVGSTTATRYLYPGTANAAAPTGVLQWLSPRAGLIKNLHIRHNTPAGNGNSIVYTVRVNGTPSAVVVTIASTSASGSDVANSVAVAQGDNVDIEITKALSIGGSPSDVYATLEF